MPSSPARSRRAVIAVVITGSLASIATSRVSQKGHAPLPPIELQVGGPPVELHLRVESPDAKTSGGITAKVRPDRRVPHGRVQLRFEYLHRDGAGRSDVLEVDAADDTPWYVSGSIWSGCWGPPCSEELTLRVQAIAIDPAANGERLRVLGDLSARVTNSSGKGPIQITAPKAP